MNRTRRQLKLSDFDISEKTGFLPATLPLRRLPGDYFSSWEDLCGRLSDCIETKQLRAEIESLPEKKFNKDTLKCKEEWQRAYVLLTFLSQAYIWAEGEARVVEKLPKKLAVPWCAVSEHVSLQPVATYGSTVLYNYGLLDSTGEITGDNLKAISTFTGTEDESWFYMVAALIEVAAVPGLKAIEHAYEAMDNEQVTLLKEDLEVIAKSIQDMTTALNRMYERCNPLTFYLKIRPYQSGSKGIKAFPNGIIFEGVDTKAKLCHGASAAQNTAIPSFDVFLQARHTGPEQEFLHTMREYMPRKHREFLETLDHLPSVRDYVMKSNNSELIQNYGLAVEAFGKFRSDHIILVTKYIVMQKKYSVNASLEVTGTGGTPFMEFLKQVRDDTVALKI